MTFAYPFPFLCPLQEKGGPFSSLEKSMKNATTHPSTQRKSWGVAL